jgi:hypothetical protein
LNAGESERRQFFATRRGDCGALQLALEFIDFAAGLSENASRLPPRNLDVVA